MHPALGPQVDEMPPLPDEVIPRIAAILRQHGEEVQERRTVMATPHQGTRVRAEKPRPFYTPAHVPLRPSRMAATIDLRHHEEDAVRVQELIESMPLWDATVEFGVFDLPPQVVARIRDQAVFAANHGARVPRVEFKVTEESKVTA